MAPEAKRVKTEEELRDIIERCEDAIGSLAELIFSFYEKDRLQDFKHVLEEIEFARSTPFFGSVKFIIQTCLEASIELFEHYIDKEANASPEARQKIILEILSLAVNIQNQEVIDRYRTLVHWETFHPFYQRDGSFTNDPLGCALYDLVIERCPELKRFEKPSL